jgi:uncharacterized protein DUF1566
MRQGRRARWAGWAGTVGAAAGLGLALILGTAMWAGAHEGDLGDPRLVHACMANKDGGVRIVGPTGSCSANKESAVHWLAGRFIDLGLTVFDAVTRLEWEKKTTTVGSGVNAADPHDVDNTYNWFDATGSWITAVNAEGFVGFAGHNDWRVPNLKELKSIIDTSVAGCGTGTPCIDPIFDPTQTSHYWSVFDPEGSAPGVDFLLGLETFDHLSQLNYVRAVRGGQ